MGSRESVVQSAPAKELGSSSRFHRRPPARLGIASELPPPQSFVRPLSVGVRAANPRVHRQASRVPASSHEATGRDGSVPRFRLGPLRGCPLRRPWSNHVSNPTTDGSFEPAQAALVLRSDGLVRAFGTDLRSRSNTFRVAPSGAFARPSFRPGHSNGPTDRSAPSLQTPSSISDVRGLGSD